MQHAIVALIVIAAALYAVWHWMPARWRRALAARVAGRSDRLAAALSQSPGCGSCESCGSCATDASRPVRASEQVVRPPVSRRE